MDFDLIATIHLATASLLALFILIMSFETAFLKRLAMLALAAFVAAQLTAMAASWIGRLEVSALEIILLRQGAFGSLTAISYGLIVGVMLNYLKISLINMFRNMRAKGQNHSDSNSVE